VSWGSNQAIHIEAVDSDDDEGQQIAASLASFAQEETARRMQAQLDAQSKQMQAQVQLSLQSRRQVAALEAQLQAQKAGGQQRGGMLANTKPQHQTTPRASAVQQQGTSALDLILNGPNGGKAGVQPALVIWTDSGKKKIEQALRKLDAGAFKVVQSITKVDADTPNSRFIVLAFAHDVAMVQTLHLPLAAAGMRVEFYDSVLPATAPAWSTVATGNRPKAAKTSKLAGQAQAGLSKAIAKAGQSGTPAKRVHGQCDYYTNKLQCHRGSDCRFACYNGPGEP
jgi:hypothetical protein